MIAVTGYFRYLRGEVSPLDVTPEARIENMLGEEHRA